ncbi:MAG TPA: metalloregulator ArsR/SmtB family transcription factor [Minicystis sp.]|nr:metalloregulator ArsR/SmtB family transcription factor [Minicystis sp.]
MTAPLDATVELLSLLAEPTRVRLLALVALEELTVAELTAILETGQSRVSTHLGKLRDAGLVRDRRAGASTFYALNEGGMPEGARRAWELVRAEVDDAVLDGDRARCAKVLAARAKAGGLDALAGQMERHYTPGRTWEALARGLVGLLRLGDVLDVGAGDGTVAELVAPRARSMTLLDRSERMIEAARARLAGAERVRCVLGDAHELPFPDAAFDQVLLLHVLTMAHTPGRVVAEAARVLRPGGDLVLVTLAEHEQGDVGAAYGELHPGFAPAKLRRMLTKTGLDVSRCDVTSREKRPPHFRVVSAFARKEEHRR